MEVLDSFGAWLRQRREGLGLTRPELADCAGCSVSVLRKIEADERRPSRQLAELLANCLRIPPQEQPAFLDSARGARLVARLGPPQGRASPHQSPAPLSPGAPVSAQSAPRAWSLPAPGTPLVGREAELATLAKLLAEPGCRLLTLVGPGGIGKTRLAIEAAYSAWDSFADGAYFASLANTSSPQLMVPAIAQAVGLSFSGPADPRSQLIRYLGSRQILLLLDNFEHLLAGAEEVVALLAAAPGLKLLVTSRERLELSGEWVFEVQGLPVPAADEVERAHNYSAFQLFLQRARRAQVDLELQDEDRAAVARICQLVEGMPLAIEIAAAWIPVLSCAEIAREIEQGLDILATRLRDVPERQRSMRAVFEHSWTRLMPEEQNVLCRLAVFRGGFTRQAAEMISGAGLDVLLALASKSYLSANQKGSYAMHELLRQFAEEKLAASGEAEAARRAHSHYFLRLAGTRQVDLEGADQLAALREIALDFDNYHAAWEWAVAAGAEDLLVHSARSLHLFFNLRSRYYEGIAFFRAAAQRFMPEADAPPRRAWCIAVSYLLYIAAITGTATDEMKRDVQCCLDVARAQNNRPQMADCLAALACYTMFVEQDVDRAIGLGEQSLALFLALDDHAPAAWVMLWLSSFYEQAGQPGRARTVAEQSLDLGLKTGNKMGVPFVLNNFAIIALCTGDYAAAERYYDQALQIAQEMEHWQMVASTQTGLAVLHLFRGEVEGAHLLAEESMRIGAQINFPLTESAARAALSICLALRGQQEQIIASERDENSPRNLRSPIYIVLNHWARALAVGHADPPLAWDELKAALRYVREVQYHAMATWLLPAVAILLMHGGRAERATELLALASSHPLSPGEWMARWPLLQELCERLTLELGDEGYHASWTRGQTLDLETVVAELLQGESPCDPAAGWARRGWLR